MAWILTTNDKCTEFYATSEDYDVNIKASSWEKLQEIIKEYTKFFESLTEDERKKLARLPDDVQ